MLTRSFSLLSLIGAEEFTVSPLRVLHLKKWLEIDVQTFLIKLLSLASHIYDKSKYEQKVSQQSDNSFMPIITSIMIQGGRRHWTCKYTRPQSFKITFSYSLA